MSEKPTKQLKTRRCRATNGKGLVCCYHADGNHVATDGRVTLDFWPIMSKPKTPTLEQLRKLAKKKGWSKIKNCRVYWPYVYWKAFAWRDKLDKNGFNPCLEFFGDSRTEVNTMLKSFLSALPDKKGQR